jgi:translation elongation factor EF-Tu-like GTPase
MNCPTCKNPINDNSTECEWCGFVIIQSNSNQIPQSDFEFIPQKVLHIMGRGTVISGNLQKGSISIDDKLTFTNTLGTILISVSGIFANNKLEKFYNGKGEVGILIANKGTMTDDLVLKSKIEKV